MLRTSPYNAPLQFEKVFQTLSSPRFLNKEGLGGNKAIFIQSYPIAEQAQVDVQIASLIKRLALNNTPLLSISLYDACMSILKKRNIFDKVFAAEKDFSKPEFKKNVQRSLNVETAILPFIKQLMDENAHQLIIIYDIDKIFPFLTLVPVLVNIQSILNNQPIVFFYPGDYDNFSLNLFGTINEDNEYRAFNLNNYH